MDLEPIECSRWLARAEDACRDWQQALHSDPEQALDPFALYRPGLTRTWFNELETLPEHDPLRSPLLRWTYHLMEQRINATWLNRAAVLRYGPQKLDGSPAGECSLGDALVFALSEPPRRAQWWRVLEDECQELSEVEAGLWQRRQAIAAELEFDSPDALQSPCEGLESIAEGVLRDCAEMLVEHRGDVHTWFDAGLGKDVRSAFPARLDEASLADWFREARFLEDVRLRDWELPRRLGPASFLRALEELGAEYSWALAPSTQPFVVAHDPLGLEQGTQGACFASLLLNPGFLARRLGLQGAVAREQQRILAVSVAFEWGARALKLLLRSAALNSKQRTEERFRELGEALLGFAPPAVLSQVVLRLRTDDPQRFIALAAGFARAERWVHVHDEDWFRNPRGVEQLRSEAALSPVVTTTCEKVTADCEALRERLAKLIG